MTFELDVIKTSSFDYTQTGTTMHRENDVVTNSCKETGKVNFDLQERISQNLRQCQCLSDTDLIQIASEKLKLLEKKESVHTEIDTTNDT